MGLGRRTVLRGVRWSKIADTLEAMREGVARTKTMPRKRTKERASNFWVLETARMERYTYDMEYKFIWCRSIVFMGLIFQCVDGVLSYPGLP